jgi:periplasmic protein TonB
MILPVVGAVLLHAALAALLLLAVTHPPGEAIDATTEVALVVEPATAPAQAAAASPDAQAPVPAAAEPTPAASPEPSAPPVATQDPPPEAPPPPVATPDPPPETPPPPSDVAPPPVPDAVPPPDPPQQVEPPPPHREPPPVAKPPPAAHAQPKPTARKMARPQEPMAASKSMADMARPAGSQAAPAAVASVSRGWQSALGAWLQEHRTYPQAARQDNEQGRVVVRFTVDRNGHVADVELVTSSGSRILDDAAQAMLRGANVPPFPADMPQDRAVITVPLRYSLTP